MMTTTHLIIGDAHAHPDSNNDRALLLGEVINDVRPDVVICIGDMADMPSLCSYDKGKKSFQGKTYKRDIDAHNDFQDKIWWRIKKSKKKLPNRRITLIGNHEERITRAVNIQPELDGTISYKDLRLEDYYNEIIPYEGATPGMIEVDGVTYAHYIISGVAGRPIGGKHHANSLINKTHSSVTVGHTHQLDYSIETRMDGSKIMGLVCGCFIDYKLDWAGDMNRLYDSGIAIKRKVEKGTYDFEWISLARLKDVYGK